MEGHRLVTGDETEQQRNDQSDDDRAPGRNDARDHREDDRDEADVRDGLVVVPLAELESCRSLERESEIAARDEERKAPERQSGVVALTLAVRPSDHL